MGLMNARCCQLLSLLLVTAAAGQDPLPDFRREVWVPNDAPQALAIGGNRLYFGGAHHVGPCSGSFAIVDPVTAMIDPSVVTVGGEVMAAIPDGTGGWFIGGDFTRIADEERRSIARINGDGSLSDWDPGGGGEVKALLL
ncbi:MAG: delta-60 repeat domain-containing protein, partial [Planctomycetota bacterium]